jgi:hypothetical protein
LSIKKVLNVYTKVLTWNLNCSLELVLWAIGALVNVNLDVFNGSAQKFIFLFFLQLTNEK